MKPDLSKKAVVKNLEPSSDPYWHKVAKGISVGLYLPGTGTQSWIARVRHDDAYRTKTLSVDTFPQAVEEAGLYAKQLRDGDAPSAEAVKAKAKKSMTVRQLVELYIDLDENKVSKGERYADWRRDAKRMSERYALPALGKLKLKAISAEDIRDNQTQLLTEVSPETVNRGTVTLRSSLNYALRKGWVDRPFWREVPLAEEREQHNKSRLKQYISQADRDAFLEAAEAPLKAICQAMDMTGARPSEVRRLRVRDVKEDHVILMTFKGNRSSGRSRKFPLTNGRLAFFQKQVKGRDPDEPLFLTEKGVEWSMANLNKATKQVRGDLPIESYTWRHCFLTDKVKAGFNIMALAKLCGTSVQYIQQNYTDGLDLAEMLDGL